MGCHGICNRPQYRATRGDGYYLQKDVRRCQTCEKFLKVEGLWCPCCGLRLRLKPRNMRYKTRLKKELKKRAAMHPLNEQVVKQISNHIITQNENQLKITPQIKS